MIDPGVAAVIASIVSLALGVASILRSHLDSRESARRERDSRRADAFVDVLRLVEIRGLAVQDQMYNLTETEDEPGARYGVGMPHRKVETPSRTDRAEARALLAAHGTRETRAKFESWLKVVEAWEGKVDGWSFASQIEGQTWYSPEDAEPERTQERQARDALGEAVSAALGEAPTQALQGPKIPLPLEKEKAQR